MKNLGYVEEVLEEKIAEDRGGGLEGFADSTV